MKALFLVIIYFVMATNAYAMPTFKEIKDSYKKSDAVLLDRHGKVIHELRVDPKGRRLEWTSIKDISPSLIKAVIQSEDQRFYEHQGVDWKAVGSAAVKNLFTKTPRGASTITMQLVSFLDKKLKPKGLKRTFVQKWDQMQAAKDLEKMWTKDEILEAYLALITFRGELQGTAAAARGLFGKEASGLDEPEALILASLIRSPNARPEDVAKRACLLRDMMKADTACEDITRLAQKTLSGPYSVKQTAALAPHLARFLLKGGKAAIASTLDAGLQGFASEVLKRQLLAVKSQNVNDGAVLVVENKTGEVLAYVASSGEISPAGNVDGIRAKRQAGSTLKPFLYALAFEKKILTPASVLKDSPLDVPTAAGIYKPEDYESDFKGTVSARTALASSLNIPAVSTLALLGEETFVSRLSQLGFGQLRSDEYYGPSLALGSADVSLYELVNAYRTLVNNGVWSELKLTPPKGKSPKRRVYSDSAAFLVSDILSDREARSATFDLENPLSTRFWSAVKTGTSKDMRDNWCIGYSQKYTVGVWVGNFSGEPMWDVSGVTGAAPVWLEIMDHLHKDGPAAPRHQPEGVIARKVIFNNASETGKLDWFIEGTEPALPEIEEKNAAYGPKIAYPVKGMIIAMDPDIPEDQQRVFFEADSGSGSYSWMLNNKLLGKSSVIIPWRPVKGNYTVSLVGPNDHIVDSVDFTVRGD
jgi:penicillin-binding protein 1C